MTTQTKDKQQVELSSFLASIDFLIMEAKKNQCLDILTPLQAARNEIVGKTNANIDPDENFTSLFNAFKSMVIFLLLGTTEEKKKCIEYLNNINDDFLETQNF